MEEIYLSVVAGSRNDDHGGNLLRRMQHFVSSFIEQSKKYKLSAELILVDWNPPKGKAPLSEALVFPKDKGPCMIRIITVPKKIHDTLAHSKDLPLFQMIAKNVGIRRARGRYILATNIDILFSDELIEYLRDELQPGIFYRTDRLDVPASIPNSENRLDFCKKNYFRINGRYGTQILQNGKWTFVDTSSSSHKKKFANLNDHLWTFWLRKICLIFNTKKHSFDFAHLFRRFIFRLRMNVHTNACGDFTLLSAKDWQELRGYPELQGYSWHLDAFLLYQAASKGLRKKELSREKCVYHIEHGKGSGYIPENHDLVFKRIKEKKISCLDDKKLLKMVALMRKKSPQGWVYNDEEWGFGHEIFQEIYL